MLILLIGCGQGAASDVRTSEGSAASTEGVISGRMDTTRIKCGSSLEATDVVAHVPVDLGPTVHGGVGYIPGPSRRAVVRDQSEWALAWKAIADTVPLPKVIFRDSVLIVVASEEYASGPFRLEIEDVRRCRQGGDIIALLRLHSQQAMQDYGDRSIRAVKVPRSVVEGRSVQFVNLPTVINR
jgi:hypothetical protein